MQQFPNCPNCSDEYHWAPCPECDAKPLPKSHGRKDARELIRKSERHERLWLIATYGLAIFRAKRIFPRRYTRQALKQRAEFDRVKRFLQQSYEKYNSLYPDGPPSQP